MCITTLPNLLVLFNYLGFEQYSETAGYSRSFRFDGNYKGPFAKIEKIEVHVVVVRLWVGF